MSLLEDVPNMAWSDHSDAMEEAGLDLGLETYIERVWLGGQEVRADLLRSGLQ